MEFSELMAYCKAQALRDVLAPTEESVHRSFCMAYSQKFHVPLPEVLKMDPEHVMLVEFTSQLEEIKIEKHIDSILDQIYTLENPNYQKEKENDLEDFIKKAEKEEAERVKKLKKTIVKKEEVEEEKKPSGGTVDFSGLKDEEEPGNF